MSLHLVEPLAQLGDIHGGEFGNVLVPDAIGEGFAIQALTVALGALALGEELIGPLLSSGRVVVVHHVAQVLDDAVEGDEVVAGGVDEFLVDAHVLERAVQHLADGVVGQFGDGSLQRAVVLLQDGLHLPEDHLVLILTEGHDTTLVDALTAIGHDLREVDLVDDS